MKLRITLISDTHTKHRQLEGFLPGGDLLIHAGDLMNSGYAPSEAIEFMNWFESQSQYDKKVFIAGNHDRLFENEPSFIQQLLGERPTIDYLQDETLALYDMDEDRSVKIYGSPWQPEFYNWAFNLPKDGKELAEKWAAIPEYTDILITHGPALGRLDTSGPPYNEPLLGCGLLAQRIEEVKPKIHVCGHIHGGYGYVFDGTTHFFNASILNERYEFRNRPVTFDWDRDTNEIEFIDEKV
jgi:Icc-related predicted phosphoesterase